MNKRNLFLSKTALTVLGIGLLIYAASRTLNFVQATMPADQKFLGYLFLLATGIGALIWLAVFLNVAEGAKQRGLSFAMGLIDLLGEGALVYADTMMESSEGGLLQFNQSELRIFVLASIGMIALNILAWYLFKLWDPKAERESQARDLVDDVSAAALKELNRPDQKAAMIAELAPTLKASILAEVSEMVLGMASQHTRGNGKVIDTRAYPATAPALPTTQPAPRLENVPDGLWMQSATDPKTGKRVRVFCLSCLQEGKVWYGGELCEHFKNSEVIIPDPFIENYETVQTARAQGSIPHPIKGTPANPTNGESA